LLPGRPGTVGRNSDLGNRLFVDAVIWKFRVGTPWRDLPERFGGWCNTHKRVSRWAVNRMGHDATYHLMHGSQRLPGPHKIEDVDFWFVGATRYSGNGPGRFISLP